MSSPLPNWPRRHSRRILCWSLACLLWPGAPLPAAESPAAPGLRAGLPELAARFQNTGAPAAAKAKEMIALVEAEKKAKRIWEPLANELRWSLERFSTGEGETGLALLDGIRMPVEDAAIMAAAHSLEESERAAEAERATLKTLALREAARRSAELIRGAKSAEEIDAFLQDIDRVQKLAETPASAAADHAQGAPFPACIALMQSLRDVLAVTPAGDSFAGQFMHAALDAPDFAPLADYSRRVSSIVAMYQRDADAARDRLGSALIEKKPREQLNKLHEEFSEAAGRSASVAAMLLRGRSNLTLYELGAASKPYRTLCGIPELIASRQWRQAEGELASARQGMSQMPALAVSALDRLLIQLERQISETKGAPAPEPEEPLRAKLAAVQQPSDLTAIALEMLQRQRELPGSPEVVSAWLLAKQLSKLATAWSAEDLNLLGPHANSGGRVDSEEIAELRERIEREIVTQCAEAPELKQAPFASLPLDGAMDGLIAKVSAEGKWRQALRLREMKNSLRQAHGASPQNQEAIAMARFYLAGMHLEAAGLWTEAAGAYKAVLAAAVDSTPVADAAARLKALAREHPKEVKAALPDPGYFAPQRW